MSLNVIITAGGRLPRALRAFSASPIKALLPVGERSLLQTAVQAVRGWDQASRIGVVGGTEIAAAAPEGTEYVREGQTVVDNIWNGMQQLGGEEHDYLVVSPDLPFLTAGALREFVGRAANSCELGFPLVGRADFVKRFPGAPNRFERLDGRAVTLGSCMYVTGPMLKRNIPLARDVYRARKFPHRLAVMLGLPIAVAYLFGRLRISAVEQRARQLTGGEVRAVAVADPAIAYDVDNLANYEYAVRLLEQRGEAAPDGPG